MTVSAKKVRKHIQGVSTHLVSKTESGKDMATMRVSDQYVDEVLSKAQELLWGGSETENIEAHNMIAKLIKDRMQGNNLN
jgi:hypothetical protein